MIAFVVVLCRAGVAITWVRTATWIRLLTAAIQVAFGGALVFITGILIAVLEPIERSLQSLRWAALQR